jgi:hypothetical protein
MGHRSGGVKHPPRRRRLTDVLLSPCLRFRKCQQPPRTCASAAALIYIACPLVAFRPLQPPKRHGTSPRDDPLSDIPQHSPDLSSRVLLHDPVTSRNYMSNSTLRPPNTSRGRTRRRRKAISASFTSFGRRGWVPMRRSIWKRYRTLFFSFLFS